MVGLETSLGPGVMTLVRQTLSISREEKKSYVDDMMMRMKVPFWQVVVFVGCIIM